MSEGKGCQRDRNARKIDISEGEGGQRDRDVRNFTREVKRWTVGGKLD